MKNVFLGLIFIKIIQQLSSNLYLWQIKEYRLDRFWEHINRVYPNKFLALLSLTLFAPLKFPQKSFKAFLIFAINLLIVGSIFSLKNILIAFFSLFFTPFIFLISLFLIFPFEKITRTIIYYLASEKIKNFQKKYHLIVIGITGSYGKTTTKFFLDQILSGKFKTLITPTSVNTPLGISLLILKKLQPTHQFLIVETGAYKIGEIREICQVVHPQIGIITGISNQHLALFGSQENIIKTKSELIEAIPKEGIIIINKQSKWQPILKNAKTKKIFFYPEKSISQLINQWHKLINPSIPEFLKINLQPALILARQFGIKNKEIEKKLSQLKLPPKTMNLKKGYRQATIIDDSFNSNPEGAIAALEYLQKFKGKKIVIMPCLIELGNQSEAIHRKIGERIEKIVDLGVITTADYFRFLNQSVKTKKIFLSNNPKQTLQILKREINNKTTILIEGRVHQEIIKGLSSDSENSPYWKSVPKKPIIISLSPNIEPDDVQLTKKLFFQPQLHKKDNYLKQLEELIKNKFGFKYVFLTNSGRSAFFILLKALNLPKNSQIAIQGFTCNAAVNPILWNNLKPIYIDIDESWNLDPRDLERKINPNIKCVVLQHSFGIPAKIEEIKALCQKHHLFLIEDLALSLGAKYKEKYCGNFSEASYLSFGRDKVISSVFGGAVVTNNKDLAKKIEIIYQKLPYPSIFWTYQQLTHPFLTSWLLPTYHLKISRGLFWLFQKLGIISKALVEKENRGERPKIFPAKLPNQLAALAFNQLKKLDRFNQHRQNIAKIYQNLLKNYQTQKINKESFPIFLRYNIVTNQAQEIIKKLRKEKIYLGDWYTKPIDPKNTNLEKFGYQKGDCPKAEKIAGKIINLPTHINISKIEAELIIKELKV